MYNLQKAKQEIDAIAAHTGELISFVAAEDENARAKLDVFKKEILEAIDSRFAALEKAMLGGEDANFEPSAVSDLGAKVASLTQRSTPPHDLGASHEDQHHEDAGFHHG